MASKASSYLVCMCIVTALLGVSRSATAYTWHVTTVDSVGNVGGGSSIAIDRDGHPHISYCDNATGALRYASWDGQAWQTQTVCSEAHASFRTSIGLDSAGDPHISYFGHGDLCYASWSGTGWENEVVDHRPDVQVGFDTALALDIHDHAHISYSSSQDYSQHYAYWDGLSWITATIESGIRTPLESTSIAIDDDGQAHVIYCKGVSHYDSTILRYARRVGTTWVIETVGGEYSNHSANKRDPAMVLDESGNPYVVYMDSDSPSSKLVCARRDGLWTYEAVPGAGGDPMSMSIDLDSANLPHISYSASGWELRHAYYDGSQWMSEVVDAPTGDRYRTGWESSIKVDGSGGLHISYSDRTTGDLMYAYGVVPEPSSWLVLAAGMASIAAVLRRRRRL